MQPRFYIALAGIAILGLAGCGGTNVSPGPAIPGRIAEASGPRVKPDAASYKRALYVVDLYGNSVKILSNTYYRQLGAITNGISYPTGTFMDQHSNLYVANELGPNVTEYAPGATSPSFTYSASLSAPNAVTVDRHGNVFVLDMNTASVYQYFQGLNTVAFSCSTLGGASGIAVDAHGDVFVAYNGSGIYEYSGGLRGCNATQLNNLNVLGITLDSNNNLICTGLFGSSVLVVLDPPYTSVTRTLGSGLYEPTYTSLNKKNTLLFVAEFGASDVAVFNYQTGEIVKTLGSTYGIAGAYAVVDSPNAVY